ncbi:MULTISPECIES: YfhO family protein [Lactobacillaceae]|uniref:YfhO family protein n=1 Tax=Lactobacillaceae TaxID=33958 RepID=UPI00145710D5|nr:YfhO family protein [Lactobacillus sp. HBUAS51381]NLR08983.1 YfhO family protein [Lactobacillus sp. HBUAS51381]
MRQTRLKFNHWRNPVLAGLMALILISVLLAIRGVTPFGDHNLLIGDLGTQYIPFFTDFTRLIHNHTWNLYNLHQAFGGSWVPVITYYLLSPFNLLLIFFKTSQIPIAVAVIIMLKISTIAGTMTFYLQEHWRTQHPLNVVFGLSFAFSGFVALNFFNLMWLDALIFLPLITWGIDRLVVTGRTGGYFGWLLVSVLTDYYLGYMTCLFVVAYFVYMLTADWPHGQPMKKWFQEQVHLIYRFIGASLLSVGSTLIVLLPTVLSMLTTPKTQTQSENFHLSPMFGLEFFDQLTVGSANYLQRLNHGPAIFVSSLVILLVISYFGLPQVKRGAKIRAGLLLLFLFLGMWLQGFNTVWHLMTPPAGYPFRNSFFFSFALILIASSAWQAGIFRLPKWLRWGIPLILGALMILGEALIPLMQSVMQPGYYESLQPLNWTAIITGLIILGVTAGSLWLGSKWLVLLYGVVIIELFVNFSFALVGIDYGSQKRYASAYTQAEQSLQAVTKATTVYRIRNDRPTVAPGFQHHYNPYNDAMWMGYNGTTAYSSTVSAGTITLAKQLGLYTRNERRLSNQGFTPVTEMLFGIYEKVSSSDTTRVGSYSGMGFAVNSRLFNIKLGNAAISNQENILQALRPSKHAYFTSVKPGRDKVRAVWWIHHHRTNFVYNHTWQVTAQATGRIYLFDPTSTSKYSTMSVNGHSVSPKMFTDGNTSMINLGEHHQGEVLRIKYASNRATPKEMEVATLPANRLSAVKRAVSVHSLQLRRRQGHLRTEYRGTMTATTSKPWAYLSLPQEKGWRVTVNGQSVKTRAILGEMTAIPLMSGKNRVVIRYHVPGGIAGLAVTLICVDGYVVLWRRKWL